MVLIGRQQTFAKFHDHQALRALIQLLFENDRVIDTPNKLGKTEDIVTALLASIQKENKELFDSAISKLEKRQISENTEWIHDDLTVFSIIIGNLKYGGHNKLTEEILNTRKTNSVPHSLDITQSLIALNNQQLSGPILPIIIIGQYLTNNKATPDKETLDLAFQQATKLEINESTTAFLRLLGQKVTDIAISLGIQDHHTEYSALIKLQKNFDKRAKLISFLGFTGIFISITAIWGYFIWQYFFGDKVSSELAGKFFSIGVVIAPIAIFLIRKKIFSSIRTLFYFLFTGKSWIRYEKDSLPDSSK